MNDKKQHDTIVVYYTKIIELRWRKPIEKIDFLFSESERFTFHILTFSCNWFFGIINYAIRPMKIRQKYLNLSIPSFAYIQRSCVMCIHCVFYILHKGCNKFYEKRYNFLELDQKFLLKGFSNFQTTTTR